MADYRQIHTSIWDDDWFCQLSSDEKVVFVWLFSNRKASVSGLYQFSEFICSRETGLLLQGVKDCIKKLSDDKKIYVEGDWVWVKNLRKYNYYKNPKADKRIQTDLDQLPDNGLKHAYIEHYKPLDSPLQAPSNILPEHRTMNNEQKEDALGIFEKTRNYIEQLLGIPGEGPSAVKAIDEIIKMGAMNEDIRAGYEWLRGEGKTVKYYSSLVGPTKTAMTKRIQEGNFKPVSRDPYEGAKRYD